MSIKCCFGCVTPKRHPGCHDLCPEYITAKSAYEKWKEEYYGDPIVKSGLVAQRTSSVTRAMKARKV